MMWPRAAEVVWVLIRLCVCASAYREQRLGGVAIEDGKLKNMDSKASNLFVGEKAEQDPNGGGKSLNSGGKNSFFKSNILFPLIERIFINFIFQS